MLVVPVLSDGSLTKKSASFDSIVFSCSLFFMGWGWVGRKNLAAVFGCMDGIGCASQVALVVKNLHASAGDARDAGSIPGLGRSPGVVNGNPLQYS